jgi:hypothetical protein
MAPRKKAKQDVETEVLLKCARRCALCYYLNNDLREKVGQVAHIDQDHAGSSEYSRTKEAGVRPSVRFKLDTSAELQVTGS